jgi:hypothetical protein
MIMYHTPRKEDVFNYCKLQHKCSTLISQDLKLIDPGSFFLVQNIQFCTKKKIQISNEFLLDYAYFAY